METFIQEIEVRDLFHLRNITIPINHEKREHLILTGKNGSGKTVLLNALIELLEDWKYGGQTYDNYRYGTGMMNVYNRKIKISISKLYLFEQVGKDNHIIAYYGAQRHPQLKEPQGPVKPDLTPVKNLKDKKTDQFLLFLADYKIQEALARVEKKSEGDADNIKAWFDDFTDLLREIFTDPDLKLVFNYRDYSFTIESQGKAFLFTQLADGYSAILDIVADLIMKMQMQSGDSLTRIYEKQGIVLIDEIETHLHLELQRLILPILTRIFPKIQFIVTTHSPFVLNSLPNAVAFDLERREAISDLSAYSYQALAEGYFGVETESGLMKRRLERLEELLQSKNLSPSEKEEKTYLIKNFDAIPEPLAPNIKAAYYAMILHYNQHEA